MFKENTIYQFKSQDHRLEFMRRFEINRIIGNYLGMEPFKVVSIDAGTVNDNPIVKKIHRLSDVRAVGIKDLTSTDVNCIFTSTENSYFAEISLNTVSDQNLHSVMTHNPDQDGYLIRLKSVSLEEATKYAEKYVLNNPDSEAIVFIGKSRVRAVTEPTIEKVDFE